jgi:hypothetical protein
MLRRSRTCLGLGKILWIKELSKRIWIGFGTWNVKEFAQDKLPVGSFEISVKV